MIYKFIDEDNGQMEIEKYECHCYIRIDDNDTLNIMELDYQQLYDLIGALNEIKKRIEREGEK